MGLSQGQIQPDPQACLFPSLSCWPVPNLRKLLDALTVHAGTWHSWLPGSRAQVWVLSARICEDLSGAAVVVLYNFYISSLARAKSPQSCLTLGPHGL